MVSSSMYPIIDPKGPFAEAHSYTDPEKAYKQCVLSGCAHDGDKKYACSAILSYQDQCQRSNKNFLRPVVPDCGECIVNLHSVFALNMFSNFPLIIEIPCSDLTTPADGSKTGSGNSFEDIITFFATTDLLYLDQLSVSVRQTADGQVLLQSVPVRHRNDERIFCILVIFTLQTWMSVRRRRITVTLMLFSSTRADPSSVNQPMLQW